MKPKMILAAVTVTLFLIILIQNTQVVVVKVLFWELRMSQIILIALTLLLGMSFGFILTKYYGYRARKQKIRVTS